MRPCSVPPNVPEGVLLTSYIIPEIIAASLLVVAGSLYPSCATVNLHLEVVN
jgi:hypothetical protein